MAVAVHTRNAMRGPATAHRTSLDLETGVPIGAVAHVGHDLGVAAVVDDVELAYVGRGRQLGHDGRRNALGQQRLPVDLREPQVLFDVSHTVL